MEADTGDGSVSTAEMLRGVVAEKLTAAAREILAVVERTVAGYEEETAGLRLEVDRQRKHLEALLSISAEIKLEAADDQFPVCEPAAGGGTELPEEEQRHKQEPSVEDSWSLGLVCSTEERMEEDEEDEEEHPEHLTEPDGEESSRFLTPTVQSDRRSADGPAIRESEDHIDLRIRILQDYQIDVLSPHAYTKFPLLELQCPRGMQEADFLDLLRSTFPQLAAQETFDLFLTDKMKKLHPLRVETLTPEEICKTTGRATLFIRLKLPEGVQPQEIEPLHREDAAPDSPSTDQTGLNTRVQSDKRKPSRRHRSEPPNLIDLRICILEDSRINMLSNKVYKKFPLLELQCTRGMQEADFLDLLRSTFPQLAAQETFDFFTCGTKKILQPFRVEALTPEEICKTTGRSTIYIRLKSPEGVQPREREALHREDAAPDSLSTDKTGLNMRVQSDKRKPSRRQTSEHQNHIDLRICILEDYRINVLSRNVYKMYKLRKLQCPHGLQETDFMDLLRSNFPQLAAQETFDFFLTDKTKRLQPLRAEALTPEEIYRSIGLSGSGNSALYIRLKAQEELQTSEKELHHAVKVSSSTSDLSRLNTTSSRSQHKDLETDKAEDEDGGRSESAVSRLWSLMVLSESAAEGGELSDDDWKPDKREKHVRESEPEKTTRKRRVKQMKQSSTKASTDNGNASLSCKVCGALRGTGNMLIKHAWSHVDDPEWLCGVCGKHSESEEQLRSHLQSHQKTHSCNICGKSFLSINGLNGHVARHKGKKPYSCKVCHKTFAQSWVLKNHMWVHVSDKPNKCDFCQKSFTSKIDLRRHRLKHTDERLHRCNLCGKSLRCLDALSKHKQSHAVRETTFACQICSKTFKTHQKCQVHMKVHAGEKPYKCPVCYMAFRFKHSMKRHIKTHREGSDLRRTEAPVQVLANRLNGTKSVVKRGR